MSTADSLILDAKKAILQEQHRRFEALRREGRWEDALRQLQATLHCAADLLAHSSELLHQVASRTQASQKSSPTEPPLNS